MGFIDRFDTEDRPAMAVLAAFFILGLVTIVGAFIGSYVGIAAAPGSACSIVCPAEHVKP